MSIVDVAIVLMVVLSALLGFRTGLIQSVFSLTGLIAGIVIASWQYKHFGNELARIVHDLDIAEAISFCLIALLVMVTAGLLGMLLKSVVHGVGFAWLDKIAGLIFGLVRGGVLVILCVVVLAAFFPDTRWLGDAQLSRYFLGVTHLTTKVTPEELKTKILNGLQVLENDAPKWLHEK
jgi:membrane protein required for colicin V production